MKSTIMILVLIMALFIAACDPAHVTDDNDNTDDQVDDNDGVVDEDDEPIIGGGRDEQGCLSAAGFSYSEYVGACTRTWEIDESAASQAEASRMAVQYVGKKKGLTVEEVTVYRCVGCFDVKFDLYGEKFIVGLGNWKAGIKDGKDYGVHSFQECADAGNPVMESYPRKCRTADGFTFESMEDRLKLNSEVYCNQEGVGSVQVCGNYIKVVSSLLGGGSTYHTPWNQKITCPVVAPDSVSDNCQEILDMNLVCTTICENTMGGPVCGNGQCEGAGEEEYCPEDCESVEEAFCGSSTNSACSSSSECVTSGCSGQICGSINDEKLASTCEWRDCYDETHYGLTCGCFNNQCKWN